MSTRASGEITKGTEEENNSGKMAAFMKGTGRIILPMVMVDWSTLMVMFTSENGPTTRPMEKEHTFPNVEPNI